MPKPKKGSRPSGASKPPPTFASPQSTSTTASAAPPPFTPAPSSLEPFLKEVTKDHIYITSIDRHPPDFKRRLFAIPLLLNIFLSVIILTRLRYALPTYISLFLTTLGFETRHRVDIPLRETGTLFTIMGERMAMMIADFVLVRFVGGWPWAFFMGWLGGNAGLGSPVAWRRTIGFRDVDIVVRRSRRWDRGLFQKAGTDVIMVGGGTGPLEEWLARGKEDAVWQERIEPAVASDYIRDKTGYLMMDKNWDLSFSGMIVAHGLVDDEDIPLDEFKTRVLIYSEKHGGWLSWDVWKDHEKGDWKNAMDARLQAVRDKLMAMGRGDLFFRCIEVIQSETSKPGPFTKARREAAVNSIEEEFAEQKLDPKKNTYLVSELAAGLDPENITVNAVPSLEINL